VALVIPFAAASWMILSTSSALTFNLKAMALNSPQIEAERISSHLLTSMLAISLNSTDGKNRSISLRMISWILVAPFETISLMNCSTCSAFTLNLAASSLILSQIACGMMSWHPNFVANSTSLFRASSISSVALVIPFAAASWMILSTSSALTFNFKAIALN